MVKHRFEWLWNGVEKPGPARERRRLETQGNCGVERSNEQKGKGKDGQCQEMQRMSKDRHSAATSSNGKATPSNVTRGLARVSKRRLRKESRICVRKLFVPDIR